MMTGRSLLSEPWQQGGGRIFRLMKGTHTLPKVAMFTKLGVKGRLFPADLRMNYSLYFGVRVYKES